MLNILKFTISTNHGNGESGRKLKVFSHCKPHILYRIILYRISSFGSVRHLYLFTLLGISIEYTYYTKIKKSNSLLYRLWHLPVFTQYLWIWLVDQQNLIIQNKSGIWGSGLWSLVERLGYIWTQCGTVYLKYVCWGLKVEKVTIFLWVNT